MPISRMSRAAGNTTAKTETKTKTKAWKSKAKAAAKPFPSQASRSRARVERKPAAAPAPADAERYALALESINESLYDRDIEDDTIYFAPGLFKILGLTPGQIRKPSDWTNRIHPDDRPLYKYTLAEHLKGNTPRFSMELRYRDGQGNWRWARQAGIALRRPDGWAYRLVGAGGVLTAAKPPDARLV